MRNPRSHQKLIEFLQQLQDSGSRRFTSGMVGKRLGDTTGRIRNYLRNVRGIRYMGDDWYEFTGEEVLTEP